MKPRSLLASPLPWLAAASIPAMALGCSSSSGPPGSTSSDASTGSDANTATDSADAGSTPDASHPGEGGHDGGAPDALYGCANRGGFGWPCTAAMSGADPTDCTDPGYPDCFVGGQGAWCSKACTATSDCTTVVEDAGCTPASCNMRGYCK